LLNTFVELYMREREIAATEIGRQLYS